MICWPFANPSPASDRGTRSLVACLRSPWRREGLTFMAPPYSWAGMASATSSAPPRSANHCAADRTLAPTFSSGFALVRWMAERSSTVSALIVRAQQRRPIRVIQRIVNQASDTGSIQALQGAGAHGKISHTANQFRGQSAWPGSPMAGLNCESPCPKAQTALAHSTPARNTLRRLSSEKKEGVAFKASPSRRW